MYKKITTLALAIILTGAGCSNISQTTKQSSGDKVGGENNSEVVANVIKEVDTTNWIKYENENSGVSFLYPTEWKLVTNDLPPGHLKLIQSNKDIQEGIELTDGIEIQIVSLNFPDLSDEDILKMYSPKEDWTKFSKGKFATFDSLQSESKAYSGNDIIDKSFEKRVVLSGQKNKMVLVFKIINDDIDKYKGFVVSFEKNFSLK